MPKGCLVLGNIHLLCNRKPLKSYSIMYGKIKEHLQKTLSDLKAAGLYKE